MRGKIYSYLANDHARLDGALRRATYDPDHIDRVAYAEFREGLLRHIGMEEKILLPAGRSANGGKPLASANKLHLDHGALAALLVPTPTSAIIAVIKTVLDGHNPVEEGPGGIYEECERLLGTGAWVDEIWATIKTATEDGKLGDCSKVATMRPNPNATNPRTKVALQDRRGYLRGPVRAQR